MLVRVGLSSSFKRFGAVAAELGAPIIVSANAFWRGRFSRPRASTFAGLDVALDSAGFIAMMRYWGYRWNLDEYVEFAGRLHPTWWAAPDYCCEPEIAADRDEVVERLTRTAFKLDWTRRVAEDKGVPPPMPVLQGWHPDDYLRCADLIPDLPSLVGVGSVCRRSLQGESGLINVVDRLDQQLPQHVLLHLFGVKGAAIARLADHPRVFSLDSAAWDLAARREHDRDGVPSKTVAYRSTHLRRWYLTQTASLTKDPSHAPNPPH